MNVNSEQCDKIQYDMMDYINVRSKADEQLA